MLEASAYWDVEAAHLQHAWRMQLPWWFPSASPLNGQTGRGKWSKRTLCGLSRSFIVMKTCFTSDAIMPKNFRYQDIARRWIGAGCRRSYVTSRILLAPKSDADCGRYNEKRSAKPGSRFPCGSSKHKASAACDLDTSYRDYRYLRS